MGRVVWYSRKGDTMQLTIHTHTSYIMRSVSEHTYIVGVHAWEVEEEGLVVLARSSCMSGPALRLARIKNKKV